VRDVVRREPGPVLVRPPAHPGLRGIVAGMVGYREDTTRRVVRRQPAGSLIPLVVSFGPRLEILDLSHGTGVGAHYAWLLGYLVLVLAGGGLTVTALAAAPQLAGPAMLATMTAAVAFLGLRVASTGGRRSPPICSPST
jgi:hypothetical protein